MKMVKMIAVFGVCISLNCLYMDNPYYAPDEKGSESPGGTSEGEGEDEVGDGDGDGDGETGGETPRNPASPCESHVGCESDYGFEPDLLCGGDGKCHWARSNQCQILKWPNGVKEDIFGFIGSISKSLEGHRTVELAIDDYNGAVPEGLRVGWIGCSSQGSPLLAAKAAEHLAQFAIPKHGLNTVVGPSLSDELLVAESHTVSAEVFTISPSATHKEIVSLEDGGLVWQVVPSDVYQASAIADRVEMVSEQQSTAIVHASTHYASSLANDVYDRISLPQKSVTKLFGYDMVYPREFPSEKGPSAELLLYFQIAAVIEAVMSSPSPPKVVVFIGGVEGRAFASGYYYRASETDLALLPDKIIFSSDVVDSVAGVIGQGDEFAADYFYDSIEVISPQNRNEEQFAGFSERYSVRFGGAPSASAPLTYDATMVAALSLARLESEASITGTMVANGIELLSDSNGLSIGLGSVPGLSISLAVSELTNGFGIDLEGISGSLKFDVSTGEMRRNYVGLVLEPMDGDPSTAVLEIEREYVLDPWPATSGVWVEP